MGELSINVFWPDELRDYMARRREKDYILVDVRQPQEYEQEHIPGAALIPLHLVMDDVDRVPRDKEVVFYCSHGMRSRAAAESCVESGRFSKPIYSLAGGLSAWEAAIVSDFPKVALFESAQTSEEWARVGMNLEKGAFLFYDFLIKKCSGEAFVKELEEISAMEIAHARLIFHLFPGDERSTEMFQDVFGALAGDIIEGGYPFSAVCRQLERMPGAFLINALELALRIEYAAYDLYRTLADKSEDSRIQSALLTLSQAEKKHVLRVAGLFQNAFN